MSREIEIRETGNLGEVVKRGQAKRTGDTSMTITEVERKYFDGKRLTEAEAEMLREATRKRHKAERKEMRKLAEAMGYSPEVAKLFAKGRNV